MEEMQKTDDEGKKRYINELLKEAEGEIRDRKENANERQSEAAQHEERLRLLRKEGECEDTTNITNSYCMDGNFMLLQVCQFS